MTWELPWVTSGVAELPVATARVLAYAATQGASGVVSGPDLKVTATATPSSTVNVAPGVFIAVSGFTGSSYESYVGRNSGSDSAAVPSTAASARYDFVYALVTDPGQTGQPTSSSPVQTRVAINVPSTATKFSDVPALAGQTGIPLARIYRGANSNIVATGDITDLRKSVQSTGTIGEIKMWSTNTTPDGYILCDGRALSRTTYSALYSVIGLTFGSGDGSSSFNVPNFTGRFPTMNGAVNSQGGSNSISVGNHSHYAPSHTHTFGTANAGFSATYQNNTSTGGSGQRVTTINPDHAHGGTTNSAGGDPTSDNGAFTRDVTNPWISIQFIIKAA